jgi:hypothetical protein
MLAEPIELGPDRAFEVRIPEADHQDLNWPK